MQQIPTSITVKDKEKERCLSQLDNYLTVLSKNLKGELEEKQLKILETIGDQYGRMRSHVITYEQLSNMVEQVRQEYRWLATQTDTDNPENNRSYFKEIDMNTETGMPYHTEIIKLNRLKEQAQNKLMELPSYNEAYKLLENIIMQDLIEIENVPNKIKEIQELAMNRNYFEQLKDTELISWKKSNGLKVDATLIKSMGAEELWNIAWTRYSMSRGLFQTTILDVWQDIVNPQITKVSKKKGEVSDLLKQELDFGEENTAWYMLKTIDDNFLNLHPVHLSKAIVGPFENKYLLKDKPYKPLSITNELLQKDVNTGILRFKRQYIYAPNHQEENGVIKQIIPRKDWSDEIIVCPGKYSPKVSKSVLGTNIRIFEV
ncbi:MAG: hypothetical protein KKC26_02450 [Nanoarchaeota archaeon]|nr:hypothetical protein [Nanoarchaeota archaeon]